ncbi:2-hydroxychromene-2-carboxylate isomerase [Algirhabdus cladophorae]|uniref:2-hydroxychromene-2-carboxylate isomerase n=1 Tax=Algirhabdus cladophorae TaxID=3377108 RepID=UPI003B845255
MAHIDYYFTPLSPFTYLAGSRLEDMAAAHGATITYKPIDIMALFAATGGTPPKDRHPNRQVYRMQELERRGKLSGLPITLKPAHWPTNAAPACYAIIAAQNAGTGDVGKLAHSLMAACWAQEKDIADEKVIKECLTAAGFSDDLTSTGLLVGAEVFAKNLEDAVAAGAFGAPFYITDSDQRFWGHDRLDDLQAHLEGRI